MEEPRGRGGIFARLPELVAALAAAAMLCALPLAFHDAFFDINRFKVRFIQTAAPACAAAMALALLLSRRRRAPLQGGGARGMLAAMALAMLAFVVSSAAQGFSEATLTGSEGRYCGLFTLLSCGAAFFAVALGALRGRVIAALAALAAAVVAALGVLNACGVDPLRFYFEIKRSQTSLFLSTIGNVDFFGTYLATILPLAAGQCAFARRRLSALGFTLITATIALGVCASRSDIAFFAMQLSFVGLAASAGDDWGALARVFLLWAVAWAALPAAQALLLRGRWAYAFTGVLLALCRGGAWVAALGLAFAASVCALLLRRGVRAPGRKAALAAALALTALAAAALAAAMAYFTWINPRADLGALDYALRLSDGWGSRRGFVYRRGLRALADYAPRDWLFGKGVDNALAILTPYFDDPDMLAYGVFNDAHCQPLQMLLTCGLFGCLSVAAFHLLALRGAFSGAAGDGVLSGAFASLFGYTLTASLSVTQPILIATYVSVAALAASRLRRGARMGGTDES